MLRAAALPLLAAHCVKCHGERRPEAGLRRDTSCRSYVDTTVHGSANHFVTLGSTGFGLTNGVITTLP